MKKFVAIFLVVVPSIVVAAFTVDPSSDPPDIFLSAYRLCQKAERLEMDGLTSRAVQNYHEADKLLKRLRGKYADWNPRIVEARALHIAKALKRLAPSSEDKKPE